MFSMWLGGPALVLAFALAGCATGLVEDKPSPTKPAQAPPASPSSQRTQGTGEVTQAPTVAHPSPSPTAEATGLDETGSELLFRLRQTPGGASDALRSALMVPIFSLYADGTAIYWNARLTPGRHEVGLQTAVLSPTQVQSLLEFALEEGGLAQAKSLYRFNTFGPAGSTVFEINAPELTKRVDFQLPIGNLMASREPEHADLKRLVDRLRSFWHDVAAGDATSTGPYAAQEYVVWLREHGPGPGRTPAPWPLLGVGPERFASWESMQVARVSGSEAGELPEVGLGNRLNAVHGPAGDDSFTLYVRPLLPDEAASGSLNGDALPLD